MVFATVLSNEASEFAYDKGGVDVRGACAKGWMKAPPRGPLPVEACDGVRPWWNLARMLLPPPGTDTTLLSTPRPIAPPDKPPGNAFSSHSPFSSCSIDCSSHPLSRSSEFFSECDSFRFFAVFNIGFTIFPLAFVSFLLSTAPPPTVVISGNIFLLSFLLYCPICAILLFSQYAGKSR